MNFDMSQPNRHQRQQKIFDECESYQLPLRDHVPFISVTYRLRCNKPLDRLGSPWESAARA